MADKRSYLAWLQTASHEDVVMALVEDGSLLLAIQQELKAAAPRPASAALQDLIDEIEAVMTRDSGEVYAALAYFAGRLRKLAAALARAEQPKEQP